VRLKHSWEWTGGDLNPSTVEISPATPLFFLFDERALGEIKELGKAGFIARATE